MLGLEVYTSANISFGDFCQLGNNTLLMLRKVILTYFQRRRIFWAYLRSIEEHLYTETPIKNSHANFKGFVLMGEGAVLVHLKRSVVNG